MKMLIGGKDVDASNGAVIDVINPATHQVIDTVPSATREDVNAAVENARKGFKEWAAVPLHERIEIIYKYVRIFDERVEELAQLSCKESGRAITLCRGEAAVSARVFHNYAEKARNFGGEVMPLDAETRIQNDLITVIREPLGVVGCIVPFNYSMELYSHKVAPALVMGNSVLVKPASDTPLANIMMTKWLIEAGVPANAAQVITGSGAEAGKYMVDNPKVDVITLTGSTAVGIEIMCECSKNLRQAHLELGGNCPLIIFADCDLDSAVEETISGRASNAGQTCCSNKRMLVQNSIKEKYTAKLIEGLKKYKVGDPTKDDTECGCLINEKAAQRVIEQIDHTVSQGAKCVLGGKLFDRTFVEPTVLAGVTPDMDIAKDMEVFGPVFPIIGFDTVDEAITIANNTRFGLSGAVMTANMKTAFKVAKNVDAGTIVINGNGNYRSMHQAFGGHKMSGIGLEGIAYTLEEFTQKKTIALKKIFG